MSTFSSANATLIKSTANGNNTSGPVSIAGLQAGDILIRIIPDGFTSGFESIVSVADEIQQITPLDWSPVDMTFILLRGV